MADVRLTFFYKCAVCFSCFDAMSAEDHHFMREDRSAHWRRIASYLGDYPEELAISLANIERWMAGGRVNPAPLIEWRRRIHQGQRSNEGMRELLDFLAADNHDAELIKSCSPFVGFSKISDYP
jgi:hypothetical protein